MRVLLDECLPRRLAHELVGHTVATVSAMGWAGMKDRPLLRLAEAQFDAFITADQNLEYQQHLKSTVLGIVSWRHQTPALRHSDRCCHACWQR